MSTFLELGVRTDFIKALNEQGIKSPTEIQKVAIPILLHSKTDLIGLAQTGTGKTAAFGLPLLQHIDTSKSDIQTLVLAPTRELVQQIQKQLFKFTKYCDKRIFSEGVYGGEKIEKQINALKRPTHIVVATPGRLIDLIERGDINIKRITTLVLDEADEMLSMGFKQDLNRILKYTEGSRNTWLFSATMPEEIKKIVKKYMAVDAARVEVNRNALVNENITHQYIQTSIKEKVNLLGKLIENRGTERGIIFCRTKAGTQNLVSELQSKGHSVAALEGDMQQRDREKVMRAFKKSNLQTLVCTDVAARGIDVNNLAYVIHHQLPDQIDYYTHRSGRTARAGKTGVSLALIIPGEMSRINELRKTLGIQFKEVFL